MLSSAARGVFLVLMLIGVTCTALACVVSLTRSCLESSVIHQPAAGLPAPSSSAALLLPLRKTRPWKGEKAERVIRMGYPDWDPYLWNAQEPSSTALACRGGIILPDHYAALISGSPNSWVTLFYSCRSLVAANSVSIICKQKQHHRDTITRSGCKYAVSCLTYA